MNNNPSLCFLLLLADDIELNAGPAAGSNAKTAAKNDLAKAIMALERIESSQLSILEKQDQMMDRLCKIEDNIEKVKADMGGLENKQAETKFQLKNVKDDVYSHDCRLFDIGFLVDKQEQYSRKKFCRSR